MSQAAKKKDDRIDLRVDDTAKELIERAASIAGMSVSSYTLSNTLRAARDEIAAHETLTLSDKDRDMFLATLADPPKASNTLRAAMSRYKKKYE